MNEKNWKKTFKTKLRQRLSELSMTQTDLAKEIEMTPQIINHYCTGRRWPESNVLIKLERVLRLPVGWFMYCDDDLSVESKKMIKRLKANFQEVPFIMHEDISGWIKDDIFPETGTYRTIPMDIKLSSKSYITKVGSDAMFSTIEGKLSLSPEDEIIVDPKLEPIPGCLVVINIGENDVKIRQYQKDGSQVIFKAFDSRYPNIIQDDNVKLLGVLYQKNISLYPDK